MKKSSRTSFQEKFDHVLVPSKSHVIFIPLLAGVLLFVTDYEAVMEASLQFTWLHWATAALDSLNQWLTSRFGIFLFWFIVTSIMYGLISSVLIALHGYRNDLRIRHYFANAPARGKERQFRRYRFWVRTTALLLGASWAIAGLHYVGPSLAGWFGEALIEGNWLPLVAIFIASCSYIYLCIVILRLLFLRSRLFRGKRGEGVVARY